MSSGGGSRLGHQQIGWGISIVDGDKEVTTGEEMDRRDGVRKVELPCSRVCLGSQSSAHSVEKKRQEVHPGVATLDGRVSGDEEQEVKVVMDVKERELILYDKWVCKWEERAEGGRQRGGVSYSPLRQTLHVSTPTRLSRSLLWLNTLSIRSGTCVLMEHHGGVGSLDRKSVV